jgi:hypothetical protein
VCLGGHCSFYNYCHADGDFCQTNTDCCNGLCIAATHRCDSENSCTPTNEPCGGLRSCCNTVCTDTGLGTGYCYPIGGCHTYDDFCTQNQDCCSLKCGSPDTYGLRRCDKLNCLPDGDVCGGLGASENCCNGGKAVCHKTSTGVSRCQANFGGTCYAIGHSCAFADECCNHLCLPDPNSSTGFSCGTACIPLNQGTCTTDTDCCSGVCQSGICKYSGTSCVPLGGSCQLTAQCCQGSCYLGTCTFGS